MLVADQRRVEQPASSRRDEPRVDRGVGRAQHELEPDVEQVHVREREHELAAHDHAAVQHAIEAAVGSPDGRFAWSSIGKGPDRGLLNY